MAHSDMGTVPETLPRDAGVSPDRSSPIDDDPSREEVGPEADLSGEEIVREAREASPEVTTVSPDIVEEAIAASEAEVGAAATRDRILDGSLETADGTSLLDGLSQDQRTEMAQAYENDIRERANGPDVELTSEMTNLKNLEEMDGGIRSILADNFQDPEAALARLRSLDEDQIAALAQGDTSVLGDPSQGAAVDPSEARALSAFADEWDQSPEAALRIEQAQDQEEARAQAADLDGRDPNGPDRQTDAQRFEQDPSRKGLEDDLSLRDRMEHQIAYQAAAVPQI
ncbi:MAG: hypothetical protein AAF845_07775 [Bacteroidota bacterium]